MAVLVERLAALAPVLVRQVTATSLEALRAAAT